MKKLEYRSYLPASPDQVYQYHILPGAFSRLSPPWEPVRLLGGDDGISEGCRRTLKIGYGPLAITWVALHEDFAPGRGFCDRQLSGPFRTWRHHHLFEEGEAGGTELIDSLNFQLPLGLPLSGLLRSRLNRMFAYRHRQTRRDLQRIREYPGPVSHLPGKPLTIGITGASGLIGSRLASFLGVAGHRVVRLVRGAQGAESSDRVLWWPEPDLERLEGLDAVVHLAGESVAQLWTRGARERIAFSRVEGTRRLATALAALERPPKVFICGSAIGIYDLTVGQPVDERGPVGDDFLARVCRDWEAAALPVQAAGIRLCHLRTGLVLSSAGGVLGLQLPAVRLGGAAILGDGMQPQSFIDIDDLVGAIYHLLNRSDLSGAFNGTTPSPVSQRRFTEELARACGRTPWLRVPGKPLRLVLGEQASMFLDGLRVLPNRLLQSGFRFEAPTVEECLMHQVG